MFTHEMKSETTINNSTSSLTKHPLIIHRSNHYPSINSMKKHNDHWNVNTKLDKSFKEHRLALCYLKYDFLLKGNTCSLSLDLEPLRARFLSQEARCVRESGSPNEAIMPVSPSKVAHCF